MRIRSALLGMTALMAAPSLAVASTVTGAYIDLGAGYNLVQKQNFHSKFTDDPGGSAVTTKERLTSSDGYNGFLSAGYGFGNGLRLEIEGAYNNTSNKSLHFKSPSYIAGAGGHIGGRSQGYGGFVNVLYDIDMKKFFDIDSPITPFVGIGAGYMWQNYKGHVDLDGNRSSMNSTKGGFAGQAIVGAAYDIPGVPGLALTGQYRFMVQTATGSGVNSGHYTAGPDRHEVDAGNRYTHQFILGLRYAFNNAPPPPPAPAHVVVPPQPTAARTYLVFFDWDKSNLTARAREIVAQAAQASTHVQTTRIEVNGYTDNSAAHPGPRGEKYNMGLSLRRANSVKAELIHDGVPAAAIDIHGYGEAHPLVATSKNTREPQNRRVEIILK